MVSLPRSASLAVWLNACLDGRVGVDDLRDHVRGEDPQHLVVDWPGADAVLPLEALPAAAGGLGAAGARLALARPGSLVGLAGPPGFNDLAVDAEEAVVVVGDLGSVGLVPGLDARTVIWRAVEAAPPAVLDPREEGRMLRQELLAATSELVRLDVASWNPDVPDLLMNLHHRPDLDLPAGTGPDLVETLERAALCLEVVELASLDDGGSVSAAEAAARARCLTDLDLAARRAAVAACSASLRAT